MLRFWSYACHKCPALLATPKEMDIFQSKRDQYLVLNSQSHSLWYDPFLLSVARAKNIRLAVLSGACIAPYSFLAGGRYYHYCWQPFVERHHLRFWQPCPNPNE